MPVGRLEGLPGRPACASQPLYIQSIYDGYMATQMITVKLEGAFLQEIDGMVERKGYQNRTEFIRAALREKIEEAKLKEALASIAHLKGAAGKKTRETGYEAVRKKAFEELARKI